MNLVIGSSRTTLKGDFAPRFYTLQIPTDKIRDLIGPGGKVIRGIIEATGVKIDVEDSGKVNDVVERSGGGCPKALQMIGDMLGDRRSWPRLISARWRGWRISAHSSGDYSRHRWIAAHQAKLLSIASTMFAMN